MLVLHWKRFLMLMVYFTCSIVFEFCWLSTVWTRRQYDRTENKYAYTVFRYFNELAFVLMYPLSSWVIERHGYRMGVCVAMILASVGTWGMYLQHAETWGSIWVGLGQPFIVNGFTKLSSAWFGPKGRPVATMFLLISVFFPLIFSEYETTKLIDVLLPLSILSTALIPLSLILL